MSETFNEGGILRFGRVLPAPYVSPDRPIIWPGGAGWLWDGTYVDSGANATSRLPWVGPRGGQDDRGMWLLVGASSGVAGASIVSTPLFDSVHDDVSLQLWATPGNAIAVQCLPILLDPLGRDLATGAWPPLLIDSVVNQLSISPPSGVAELELFWLDKTKRSFVGSAANAWSTTPALTFTPQTTWGNLTPPTSACYVAVRFTWTVDAGAGTIRTANFREPAIGWKASGLVTIVGTGKFEPRYV